MALDTNLISYWKFDENAASTSVIDSHGSNDATASTNTSNLSATGKLNTSFDFDGSTEYLTVSNESNFRFDSSTQDFSISAWIYLDNVGTTKVIWDKRDDGGDGYRFEVENNILHFQLQGVDIFGSTTLSINTWYHVGVSVDRSGNAQMYLNGSTEGSATSVSGNAMATTTSPKIASRSFSTIAAQFDGRIDEIGIWSRELSSTDITDLYNSGNGLAYPFVAQETVTKSFNSRIQVLDNEVTKNFTGRIQIDDTEEVYDVDARIEVTSQETKTTNARIEILDNEITKPFNAKLFLQPQVTKTFNATIDTGAIRVDKDFNARIEIESQITKDFNARLEVTKQITKNFIGRIEKSQSITKSFNASITLEQTYQVTKTFNAFISTTDTFKPTINSLNSIKPIIKSVETFN